LKLAYNDEVARRYQAERAKHRQEQPQEGTPVSLVQQASQDCRAARYEACLAKTKQAIGQKPDFAEAYNVMAMALIATQRGDEGIEALRKAVQLKPDFEMAKRNLAWALEERRKALGK
jgi:tetratricopeptide (TPR) repeat protein